MEILPFLLNWVPWDTKRISNSKDLKQINIIWVSITAGNGGMARGAENNNIINPFEHMFNAVMSKYIKKCISHTALDSSGHHQAFHSTMSNKNSLIPWHCQVGFVHWCYRGIVIFPFYVKRGCLGSGWSMCNLATCVRYDWSHDRDDITESIIVDTKQQPVESSTSSRQQQSLCAVPAPKATHRHPHGPNSPGWKTHM